jgi:hypothetical protein
MKVEKKVEVLFESASVNIYYHQTWSNVLLMLQGQNCFYEQDM